MKDKQIEEMASVIKTSLDDLGSGNFNFTGFEISTMFAEALYNAGYRKSTEVAREIFEEIERAFFKYYDSAVTKGSSYMPSAYTQNSQNFEEIPGDETLPY